MTSPATVQEKTAAKRRELQRSVGELRDRLSPSQLSNDVGDALTSRVATAGQVLGNKAATPVGVVSLAAMAFSSAFAMTGAIPKNRRDLDALAPVDAPRPLALSERPPPRKDVALMLVQLSAAVAAGAVISRFIPATEVERTVLAGVGPELRRNLQDRITEGAQRLVSPPEGSRYGVVNLLALGGAMLLSRKRGGNANA